MFSVSLGILLAGGIALQMEETKAASNSDIEAVFGELTTALEKQTGDTVSVNSLKDDPTCRSKDKCIASILKKTASTEVVFVSIEKKPSAFQVRLHRTSGGGLTPTVAKVELPRAQATWGAFLSGAAIMLFPEGANLTPPIVAAARPKAKTSQPMVIPSFEIKKTLPPPKPKPVETKKPEPAEAKKAEPKPVETKKPEPKTAAIVKAEPKPAEAKKPEPKPIQAKKPEPKPIAANKPKQNTTKKSAASVPALIAVKKSVENSKGIEASDSESEPNKPKLVMPKLIPPKAKAASSKKDAVADKKSKVTKATAKKEVTNKKGVKTADMLARAGTNKAAEEKGQAIKKKKVSLDAAKSIDIQPRSTMLPTGAQNFAAISVEPSGNKPWPWLALGASVITAGIGTYFGIENQNLIAEGELVRDRTRSEMYQDEVYQAGLTANVMFTTAAVSALASAILFMVP
ncbi:MAG: hypothetical protein VYC39_14795 [Myxococcota bacterium]|nr:hypothetical protein [Myxococcota bacterium]